MFVNGAGIESSGGVDVGDIEHSLRLRSSASVYLSRTITTDTTSTYFAAVKRGKLGVISPIFDSTIKFNANDTLTAFGLTTTAVFRDPSSWLFIHVSNGGLYVNGVSYGAVTTSSLTNPRIGFDGTNYFDGYIARLGCVAGSSSSYTNFGYFNTEINEWVSKSQSAVKAVVDAGGTSSFMLDFDNGTSTTTLGYDKSSKGNNWTCNNISLTAGTTYDWMLDVPGNSYAVWSQIDKGTVTISEANLAAVSAADVHAIRASHALPLSGKWYWEITVSALSYGTCLGIADNASNTSIGASSAATRTYQFGSWFNTYNSGLVQYGTNQGVTGGVSWSGASQPATNDTIMFAVDMDYGSMWVGKNGTWFNSGGTANPATNTDPRWTGLTGTAWFPYLTGYGSVTPATCRLNAGQRPFAYTPPAGYKALCQENLPDPSVLNPKDHFDILLHIGNGGSQSITGANFVPDLVWIKKRSSAESHEITDSNRGNNLRLSSNFTEGESTGGVAMSTGGISLSGGYGTDNENGQTYVDWLWKAGGAGVTNNAGSIASVVSANQTAGFSVVTATLSAANGTIGHGLGIAPKLIVGKRRNSTSDWVVFHSSLTSAAYVAYLNTTAAQTSSATTWNSTAPTSSLFSVGTGLTGDYVFYCFAEIPGFSKAFSFTGNASADGTYVNLGFKAKLILLKCSSTTGNWYLFDTVRNTYNVIGEQLWPNLSTAASTVTTLDIDSQGFKMRLTGDPNAAQTYIGFAWADVAGKYALAR